MNITIAVHVSVERVEGEADIYRVRPLFFEHPKHAGTHLSRALDRLSQSLRIEVREAARQNRHEALARWAFCPRTHLRSETFHFMLRSRTVKQDFHFVEIHALDRRIAFCPEIPDLWFEIEPGKNFSARAAEVLESYWREQEKEAPEECAERLEELEAIRRSWVTNLEVDVPIPKPKIEEEIKARTLASIVQETEISGEAELLKVGRNLESLYPDQLDRALLRDREVEELGRILSGSENRPVVLLGRSQVGKTAVLHEVVRRRLDKDRERAKDMIFWLLAPQRLIAGMIYLGQWEERLLAILKVARERKLVLCFDDFLGLYSAGVTAHSDLSVAQVLKPYVERGECRILAEMTPEAWRVFRERDRGFADLFHVLPVEEPREDDVHRMLIHSLREMERQYCCVFEPDAIPTVVDLQRRFAREAAFPGKAGAFLRTLAVEHASARVTRDDVLIAFQRKNGFSVSFLDPGRPLTREAIQLDLESRVFGQPEAVEAMTDAVCVAKARLNDPGKPLATLLFLGPTGVGKTECAKALAGHLFGDAGRLIRFDMNEYPDAEHASQLAGTFQKPEGLLTSAARRQPFSVVLFDEIEKAHPDVFDLLLQVMGEGRLTDALGRTSDFTNSVIILTSNLGVRESQSLQGFVPSGQEDAPRAEVFLDAARRFFRPEFLNRIDRIVPFRILRREDIRRIAEKEIKGILSRGGLQQRKCAVEVFPEALEFAVEKGYQPELGARAMKRALQKQIVEPLAVLLAAATPQVPVYIRMHPSPAGIRVHVEELEDAGALRPPAALGKPAERQEALRGIKKAIARIEGDLVARRPGSDLNLASAAAGLEDYFLLRDRARSLKERVEELEERLAGARLPRPMSQPHGRRFRLRRFEYPQKRHLQEICKAKDVAEYLRRCLEAAEPFVDSLEDAIEDIVGEARLLDAMARNLDRPDMSRCLLVLRQLAGPDAFVPPSALLGEGFTSRRSGAEAFDLGALPGTPPGSRPEVPSISEKFQCNWLESFDVQGSWLKEPRAWAFHVQGPGAAELCALQEGCMLCWTREEAESEEGTQLFISERVLVPPEETIASVLGAHFQKRRTWIEDLASGRATMEQDPIPKRPVIRIAKPPFLLDLRTDILAVGEPLGSRKIILPLLPLPPEIAEARG